jgi:hypothetical protein
LVSHLEELLVVKEIATLSDPRFYSAEEQKTIFNKALCGSINMIVLAIEKLGEYCAPSMEKIMAHAKFWQRLQSDDSAIRDTMYKLMNAMLCVFPEKLCEKPEFKINFINYCFKEKQALAHGYMWAAALLSMKSLNHIFSAFKSTYVCRVSKFMGRYYHNKQYFRVCSQCWLRKSVVYLSRACYSIG